METKGKDPSIRPKKVVLKEKNKDSLDIELLRLKYEKLQYIEEKESDREKTVEAKASMFIGSTSIMGAIIIGCANLVSEPINMLSYVNTCILSYMFILILCLGRSITYSLQTLRKRVFWYLDINDLEKIRSKEVYYKKLIVSTIKIINHNQEIINSKVDSMHKAQQCFIDFWIWSGIFIAYLVSFHILSSCRMEWAFDILTKVVVTMILSSIMYLILKSLVRNIPSTEENKHVPNDDKDIMSLCMMVISQQCTDKTDCK